MPKLKFEGLEHADYPGAPIEGGEYGRFRWKDLYANTGPINSPGGGWDLVDDVLTIGSGNGAAFHPGNNQVVIASRGGADFALQAADFASYEGAYFVVIGYRDGERVANKRVTFGADPQEVHFGAEFAAVDRLKFKRWDAHGPTTEIACEAFAMDDVRYAWTSETALI